MLQAEQFKPTIMTATSTPYLPINGTPFSTALKCPALPGAVGACAGEQAIGATCMGDCTQPGMTGQTMYRCYDDGSSRATVAGLWKLFGRSTCVGV